MATNADQLALQGLLGQLNELLAKLTALAGDGKSLNSAPPDDDFDLAAAQAELYGYN